MTFTIDSKILVEKTQLLNGVLPNNTSLPILENFLFTCNGNKLTLKASDLDNTMVTCVDVEEENCFCIAIPGKLLIDLLKTFPNQPLKFEILENNTVEITSNSGKYSIAYFNGDEFPELQEPKDSSSISLDSNVLLNAINKVLFAIGNDDLRTFLNGICFDFNTDRCVFVATDAFKLSKYTRYDVKATYNTKFIVPKKPLNILKNTLANVDSEVQIIHNVSNAKFIFDDFQLYCRLIDGTYPNYEGVIPKENDKNVVINRNTLLSSLKRISIFSNKTTNQVKLSFSNNSLQISTEDKDYANKGDENINCVFSDDDITIGFNSKFMIEMLSILNSEEVLIEMSTPKRAGIIKPIGTDETVEEVLMLAMPVMLN